MELQRIELIIKILESYNVTPDPVMIHQVQSVLEALIYYDGK